MLVVLVVCVCVCVCVCVLCVCCIIGLLIFNDVTLLLIGIASTVSTLCSIPPAKYASSWCMVVSTDGGVSLAYELCALQSTNACLPFV